MRQALREPGSIRLNAGSAAPGYDPRDGPAGLVARADGGRGSSILLR